MERYRARDIAHVRDVARVGASDLGIRDWTVERPQSRNPKFVIKSDDAIARAVRDAFRYDPRMELFNIQVDVDAGEVTLRGIVDNVAAKRSAEQDARNTVGVSHVTNRIKVRPAAPVPDSELAERLQAAFLRDPYIENYEISADVENGIAKLHGNVDSYFEKSQVDFVAGRVDGMVRVINNLDVRKDHRPLVYDPYLSYYPPHLYDWYNYDPVPSYRSDRAIREDIRDQLWWSPFVDSDSVAVTVANGRATLTGEVGSWSEQQSASENAWEGGASWVVNNLEVKAGDAE